MKGSIVDRLHTRTELPDIGCKQSFQAAEVFDVRISHELEMIVIDKISEEGWSVAEKDSDGQDHSVEELPRFHL